MLIKQIQIAPMKNLLFFMVCSVVNRFLLICHTPFMLDCNIKSGLVYRGQVMAGVDLTSVKELLGHKDIKMTLRYSHLAPGHKRKAVQVLDKIMDKNEDENLYNGHNLGTMS